MKTGVSLKRRRFWVVVNYLVLLIYLVMFHYWEGMRSEYVIFGVTAAMLIILVVSFIQVHVKTRMWILTHSKTEKLDEREIQLTYGSLRYSYSILAVVCLSLMYVNGIVDKGGFSALVVGSLVYFAHTLPASVIIWTQEKI